MTMMPNNIFREVDHDRDLFNQIKKASALYGELESNLYFNFYLYETALMFHKGQTVNVKRFYYCIEHFCNSNRQLELQTPIINNTYQIASMQNTDSIIAALMGRTTPIFNLNSDAAKLGALMALVYKKFGIGKTEQLSEALLLTKNVI